MVVDPLRLMEVQDARGRILPLPTMPRFRMRTTIHRDGQIRELAAIFLRLTPGSYRLLVQDAQGRPASADLDLGDALPSATVNFQFP